MRTTSWPRPLLQLRVRSLFVEPRARLLASSEEAGVAEIAIDRLVCGLCAARVESVLRTVPGVEAAPCELGSGKATVHFDPRHLDPNDLPERAESAVILMLPRRWLARAAQRWTGVRDA